MTGSAPVSAQRLAADYAVLRSPDGLAVIEGGERDFVRADGSAAFDYLQGQCSQDLAGLEPGQSTDSLVLEPQGKLDALVRVTRVGGEEYVVDVDAGSGVALLARLLRFKIRIKADIEALDWHCVAVRGSAPAFGFEGPGAVARPAVAWPGVAGVDLLGPAPVPPPELPIACEAAWEAVRIEAGIPRMGAELDERTIAAEAGLVERAVSFTKGCYTGQELVARLDSRGSNVARRLRAVVCPSEGPLPVFDAGSVVEFGAKQVGTVTSVAWSPGLASTVALAYLHRGVVVPGPVTVAGHQAEARELPLVGAID